MGWVRKCWGWATFGFVKLCFFKTIIAWFIHGSWVFILVIALSWDLSGVGLPKNFCLLAWPGRDLPPLRTSCNDPQGDGPRRGFLLAKLKCVLSYLNFVRTFASRYRGPLNIVEFSTSVAVHLRDPQDNSFTKAHVSNLKFLFKIFFLYEGYL